LGFGGGGFSTIYKVLHDTCIDILRSRAAQVPTVADIDALPGPTSELAASEPIAEVEQEKCVAPLACLADLLEWMSTASSVNLTSRQKRVAAVLRGHMDEDAASAQLGLEKKNYRKAVARLELRLRKEWWRAMRNRDTRIMQKAEPESVSG